MFHSFAMEEGKSIYPTVNIITCNPFRWLNDCFCWFLDASGWNFGQNNDNPPEVTGNLNRKNNLVKNSNSWHSNLVAVYTFTPEIVGMSNGERQNGVQNRKANRWPICPEQFPFCEPPNSMKWSDLTRRLTVPARPSRHLLGFGFLYAFLIIKIKLPRLPVLKFL